MHDNLIVGVAIGLCVGIILARNNQKVSEMIETGKEKVKETIDKI